jgi:hypothetical protein
MKLKMAFAVLVISAVAPTLAWGQSKSGKVCVWADSEDPGVLMPSQAGGSVNSIAPSRVQFIRQLIVEKLRADKTNNIVDPCPETGENIELDVVIGQFREAYVASLSFVMAGGKDGPIHVSSNVLAAKTDELLASDVAFAYASLKLKLAMGDLK